MSRTLGMAAALSLVTPLPAVPAQAPRTVTVTGSARLEYPPDSATLTVGVLLRGERPEKLQQHLRRATAKILEFVSGFGIADADVSSAGLSIDETDRDYDEFDCPRVPDKMSYEGTASVRIVLRQMESYDALVRGLFENGATRIDQVSFESSRAEEWARKARTRAAVDAAERAKEIADGLGQLIGRPLQVSDGTRVSRYPYPLEGGPVVRVDGVSGPVFEEEVTVSAANPKTLRASTLSVFAKVSVIFELLDAIPTAETLDQPGSIAGRRESARRISESAQRDPPAGHRRAAWTPPPSGKKASETAAARGK